MCDCVFPESRIKIPQTRLGRVKDYDRWKDMVRRCYHPKHKKFKDYGGRGIRVCEQWMTSFKQYLEDVGDRPEKLSIDRRDNDGNYCPCNFRWATSLEQNANRRVLKERENSLGRGIARARKGFQVMIWIEGMNYYVGFSNDLKKAQKMFESIYFEWHGKMP